MRQAAIDESIRNIRTKSSPEENQFVFENLTLLRKQIQEEPVCKRDFDSILSDSVGTSDIETENLSHRKKGNVTKQLFSDNSNCSSNPTQSPRLPFQPIDMNILPDYMSNSYDETDSKPKSITGRQRKFQDRTARAKARKLKRALSLSH